MRAGIFGLVVAIVLVGITYSTASSLALEAEREMVLTLAAVGTVVMIGGMVLAAYALRCMHRSIEELSRGLGRATNGGNIILNNAHSANARKHSGGKK